MPQVETNGVRLEYEAMGDPADPPLLLVMGLGAQMTTWPDGFCRLLVDRGYYVVRYDNRDCGLSTHFDHVALPDLMALLSGQSAEVPYDLNDIAADAAGLLDALGLAPAHVVGASMGGMIVQALAVNHPDHVRSVCSIMSTTGAPGVGQPTTEAAAALLVPPATTRDEAIENSVAGSRVIAGKGFPFPEDEVRRRAAEAYDRAFDPAGVVRQMAAILASPDRTEGLGAVRVPFLVIHGADDPLVTLSGGEATAAAVPGAVLMVVPGMGHDLPAPVWTELTEAIADNAAKAG